MEIWENPHGGSVSLVLRTNSGHAVSYQTCPFPPRLFLEAVLRRRKQGGWGGGFLECRDLGNLKFKFKKLYSVMKTHTTILNERG